MVDVFEKAREEVGKAFDPSKHPRASDGRFGEIAHAIVDAITPTSRRSVLKQIAKLGINAAKNTDTVKTAGLIADVVTTVGPLLLLGPGAGVVIPLEAEASVATGIATLITKGLELRAKRMSLVGKSLTKAGDNDALAAQIVASLSLSDIEDIAASLGEDIETATVDAAQRALIQIGVSTSGDLADKVTEQAAKWAQDHAAELTSDTLVSSTKDMVQRTISSGLEQELSPDEIADNVVDVGFDDDRAQRIAENEMGDAVSQGALTTYTAAADAGISIKKSWLTAGDDKVDEDICRKNEEQGPIPVEQAFQSGHQRPLGHLHCRCSLVPVIDDTTGL